MAISKPTSRDTKTVILSAYNTLYSEYQQTLSRLKEAEKSGTSRIAAPALKKKSASVSVPSVGASTVSGIISSLEALGENFGSSFGALSAKLRGEALALQELHQKIEDDVTELKGLHQVDASADHIEALKKVIADYEECVESFEESLDEEKEAAQTYLKETRSSWRKETEEHKEQIKERDSIIRKERRREVTEFDYQLAKARKLVKEENTAAKLSRTKETQTILEEKDNAWSAREEAVTEQETAQNEAETEALELDDKLNSGIKKAKEEGAAIARKQAKITADLNERKTQGEHRVYELEVQSREATIQDQMNQIQNLERQVKEALRQAQDLAVKAIEGPSHTASFEALKEIALKQASGMGKK